jgi:hypothetical protein
MRVAGLGIVIPSYQPAKKLLCLARSSGLSDLFPEAETAQTASSAVGLSRQPVGAIQPTRSLP